MPSTKLTLSADKELIKRAKKLAAEQGTSVSAMFSRFLLAMTRVRQSKEPVGPLTRQATGLIRLPPHTGDEQLLEEALAARYRDRR